MSSSKSRLLSIKTTKSPGPKCTRSKIAEARKAEPDRNSSTNLALPLAQRSRLATNLFSPTGGFTITNPAALAASFFLLQLP